FLVTCTNELATMTITASICSQTNVIISRIDFLSDGSVIGSDTSDPYSIVYQAPVGNHVLTAKAYGSGGVLLATSAGVNIVVRELSLSSPVASGSSFQFVINGLPSIAATVQASSDLSSWSTIDTVTLNSSGTYTYTETGLGSTQCRFYRVQQNSTCSCNSVGFSRVIAYPGSY